MRHTKIIATLGPASSSSAMIDELVLAGAEVVRLNFSHGSPDSHAVLVQRVRDSARRAGRIVAVLQDLAGPKIRTGPLVDHQPLQLRPGDELRIVTGDFPGSPGRISTPYADLAQTVRPGDTLLLDDGRIELKVKNTGGREIVASVVEGGLLGERKGINAPGVPLPAFALTPKDIEDVRIGVDLGVDLVALSFVRTAADLRQARDVLVAAGGAEIPLIAKLERPEALMHLDEILGACEAVMVARGDLGLELPLERVPRLQKEITRKARARGTPVIVATQVFESMTSEPRPTRAEVSDAANAVDDGVDAIMLAAETAIGSFPVRAVHTLDLVIRDAEAMPDFPAPLALDGTAAASHAQALCEAAVTLANRGDAQAIVAVTRAGATARLLSALRPRAPIFAATERQDTAQRLCLCWGVVPLVTPVGDDVDTAGALIGQELLARGVLPPGSVAVLVSAHPDLERSHANFLKLQRLG